MIKPTVGRVVWYHPGPNDDIPCDRTQPLAAIVAYVHNDKLVNLTVSDMNGGSHKRTSIELLQDGQLQDLPRSYCEWMPYQKGQAAKTEQIEQQLVRVGP